MPPELQPLLTWLQSLGTVGYILAGAVSIGVMILYQRSKPAAPVVPTPDPTPANTSPLLKPLAPYLEVLLKALGVKPSNGIAYTIADVPHNIFAQVGNEWDAVSSAKVRQHAAALAGLQTPPPVTPTAPPAV